MTAEELRQQYPYLYETHCHTSNASKCGGSTGTEMARAHYEAGYSGIIVTDHNWGGNTCIDRSLPWKEWVTQFFEGYRLARAEGDRLGLQVFPGWEAGYGGPEFLIYGLSPEWLMEHEELKTASVKEQYEIVHAAGGLVIQAHPFREEFYIDRIQLFPDAVDGSEIVNATHSSSKSRAHNNPFFDEEARLYARLHNHLTTSGSDVHTVNLFGGGMAFKTKITSYEDFLNRIRNREDYVLTNGEQWFTRSGEQLV